MAITRDDVRRVASLARLQLTPEEEDRFTADLGHILDHFTALQRLDTAAADVMRPLDATAGAPRADAVTNPAGDDALLENAPDRHGRLFHVPKIIE